MKKFIKKNPEDCIIGYMEMVNIGSYQRQSPVLYIRRIDENGVLHKEYISMVIIINGDIYYRN